MIYFGMFREEANRTKEHPTTSTVLQSFVNCKNTCKDLQKKFMGQHVNLNMVLPLLHASAAVRCKPLPQDRKIMLRFSLPGKTVLEAQNTSNLSCPFREHPVWYTIYDHLLVGFHRGTHKRKGHLCPKILRSGVFHVSILLGGPSFNALPCVISSSACAAGNENMGYILVR